MKISKSRIKQLISESIRKVLKESNEDKENNNKQNEIYTKVAPFIHDDKDESFNSGLTLLEQLVKMESYKIKAEEAIKEIAEDLFKKIKDNPPEGDKELENRVDELYRQMMAIQDQRGRGKEYYAIQGMYEDLWNDHAETVLVPPISKKCHEKLEKILKLIGTDAPSLDEIYGKTSFDPFDDEYDEYDGKLFLKGILQKASKKDLNTKPGTSFTFDDIKQPAPSYEYSDDDDDFLY